tara:strand:- start:150 stop:938 length:789 start_codon:yes stop_codon:yes gene_type:complete
MAGRKLLQSGIKALKKGITKSQKASKTTSAKVTAASKEADKIKSKSKQVSTKDGAAFFNKHGEKLTFKNFSSRQAKTFMKAAKVTKIKSINKAVSEPIKTPLGTKYKRRKPVKEQSKESIRKETSKGLRNRPENDMTTILGKRESSGIKPDPKKLALAKKQSNIREPKSEFESRLNQTATAGGVEIPRKFSTPKDPKATTDQIRAAMRGDINLEPEVMDNLSADDLIKVYEAGRATKKSYGGKIGSGKTKKGYGKAFLRNRN